MRAILHNMPPEARTKLRGNLHKVAAMMAQQQGTPIARDEVTIKEAAYLLGVRFYKKLLEKRAMLNGIMCVRKLGG